MTKKSTSHRIFEVSAFTRQPGAGNPAGVVLDADDLSDEQMRRIANSIDAHDTAFVSRPTSGNNDVRVRFLTPRHEALFIGHATLAAQYVCAKLADQPKMKLRQECGIGTVEIEVLQVDGDYRIAIVQSAPVLGPLFSQEHLTAVLDALSLTPEDLNPEYPLQVVDRKAPRLFVGLRSAERLRSVKPNFDELKRLSPEVGADGYFVFSVASRAPTASTRSRLFCPAMGIPEDPVSGNTHAMLGVYLLHHGLLEPQGGKLSFQGHQGEFLGRAGIVNVEVACHGRVAESVRIAGDAVITTRRA
jgi:PhzF family phenazine biosynthesis protein